MEGIDSMTEYEENYPEWLKLLYDERREEAFHELDKESETFRYYRKLAGKIMDKNRVTARVIDHDIITSEYKYSKKELQELSDLIAAERVMDDMIQEKVYWKAWRDCIMCLRMAGVISNWEMRKEMKHTSPIFDAFDL